MAQTAKARKRPPSRLVTLPSEIKLFIMDPLSLAEVGRLCRAHTSWRDIAQYCMYKKDVAEDTSTAVLWAALGGRDDPTGRYEMQCYVLRRFMQRGQVRCYNDADRRAFAQAKVNARYVGDDGTFATALHFAAAKGRLPVVKQLLGHGASLSAKCSGFQAFESRGIPTIDVTEHEGHGRCRFGSLMHKAIRNAEWLPLMAPLLLRHYDVVKALVFCKAPAILTQPPITVFHYVAAMGSKEFNAERVETEPAPRRRRKRKAEEESQSQNFTSPIEVHLSFFKAYPDYLDVPFSRNQASALHIAIQRDNEEAFNQLIDHGADVNALTILDCSPLHEAVKRSCAAFLSLPRPPLRAYISRLLERGADPNAVTNTSPPETPMMCILPVDNISWGARHARDMEAILDALIRCGARVDEGLHQGRTMMHYINDRILDNLSCEGLGYDACFEKLLFFLHDHHEAKVNARIQPGNRTILGELIRRIARDQLDMPDTWSPTKAYFKKLLNIEAHVSASEADEAFRHWLARPALRSLYSNIVNHCKGSLSQPVIDEAFTRSIEDKDPKLWKAICKHLGPPTNASQLVATAFDWPFDSFWQQVRDTLRFDAKYVSPLGETYLHMLVRRLKRGGYSRTKLALVDAHVFVEKSVVISALDANGKMAVQYLREEGLDFATELRVYLMDERDRELNTS
ncbi:ankyrin repeat-containing protein [Purpureocillium lilacinum]|uniref:Ankyrin repeat-containing protein n=1 Tax=Purpureocillium lilacinum TaxID=33203 RepID=A0A2U3ED59_PURLI|nr:ankyrin repeat-containing protein [Purpureocillium lilacinum]